jgi:hypothetical protein
LNQIYILPDKGRSPQNYGGFSKRYTRVYCGYTYATSLKQMPSRGIHRVDGPQSPRAWQRPALQSTNATGPMSTCDSTDTRVGGVSLPRHGGFCPSERQTPMAPCPRATRQTLGLVVLVSQGTAASVLERDKREWPHLIVRLT